MEDTLERIRTQKASKIASQAQQAALLLAIEAAVKEEGQALVAPAYFASLISLLDRDVAPQATGILSIIVPYVSHALLVSKLDFVVAKLAPVLVDSQSDTAHVRSAIGVLEAVLKATELSVWHAIPFSEPGPLRTFAGLLALAEDSRPKIRKRSFEAIPAILSTHPNHPASSLAIDNTLKAVGASREPSKAVHSLQLLKVVVSSVSASELDTRFTQLCETLLDAIRSSDQYVVIAALDVFNAIFSVEETSPKSLQQAVDLLSTAFKPSATDKQLTPAWCAVIAQAYSSLAKTNLAEASSGVVGLVDLLSPYIAVPPAVPEVAESAAQCIMAVFTEVLQPEILLEDSDHNISQLSERIFGLLHTRFHKSWILVCQIIATFLDKTQSLVADNTTIHDLIKVVGALRKGELRDGVDLVLGAAIRNIGPERIIDLIPLQLDESSGQGRAWMLPLLRDNVQHAHLGYFSKNFIPLADKLSAAAQRIKNPKHAKIVSTVVDQIWMLWPRFCDLPKDTSKALTKDLVGIVLSRLYESPGQRPIICQGLRLLVESNLVYSNNLAGIDDPIMLAGFSVNAAKRSLEFISKTYAADILKALLNTYTTMSPDTRGYVLETIEIYLAIISSEALNEMFNQVSTVLAQKLQSGDVQTAQTMMDVVIALVPHLAEPSQQRLFLNLFQAVVTTSDPLLQKKSYKAFTQLAKSTEADISSVATLLLGLSETTLPAARRNRLQAFIILLERAVPNEDIGAFVFTVLPETILACRDPNEKSRDAAFELLVAMGQRMADNNGVVDHSQIPAIGDDAKTPANITEYFEMIMAGLVGSTPHMVSATVTALSRVFYEFKNVLDLEKQWEYTDIVWILLDSPTREVVASVLGFVKVSILVLPTEEMIPRLPQLLNSLLGWSGDHKNHFKSKVRHIIERLFRRVGYATIAAAFPEDHMKLLQNIQKNKERSKRKKNAEKSADADDGDMQNERPAGRKFDNEFDEALYGSSAESDSEDEEEKPQSRAKNVKQQPAASRKQGKRGQYIVNSDSNDPLDLLDESALAHISSSRPQPAPRKEMRHRLREKDGKLIISEDSNGSNGAQDDLDTKEALNAYVEAIKSGPVRTQRGKFKFKRGRKAMEEDNDDEAPSRKPVRKPFGGIKKKQMPHRRHL